MPTRRTFLKEMAAATAATAASARRVPGANDRVRVGFIGIGLIGTRHLLDFQAQPDVEIAGISELSDERMARGVSIAGNNPSTFSDFRRMLDRHDIDAVVVSTPDHWHALMTILACAAGKDVYVEKPLTWAVREGEWMLSAQKAHKRVVQTGTQQRSGSHYQRARSLIRAGEIGDVRDVRIGAFRNILPGFTQPVGKPLSAEQWDMWLGPAPFVAFDPNRCLYHFRWFDAYSGGQTTNLLAHEIDVVQWVSGRMPVRVAAFAQRKSLTGFGETPDVFEAIFEYPDFLVNWSSREISAGGRGDGMQFYGTRGTLTISRRGFEITPDENVPPDVQIPTPSFGGDAPPVYEKTLRTQPLKEQGFEQVRDQFRPHVRNFVDCVKSRDVPAAPLDGGHMTAIACHLANIAARVGRVVHWDNERQTITDDPEAAALLTRTYRAPWDRELHAVVPGARS
jgi:predicted dehydrogenase